MTDPVWARDHVLTVLQRFEREGKNPTFTELQQDAAMGREDLSSTLTVLDEEGSVRQLDGGRIQLVERAEPESVSEPEAVTREEEALAEGDEEVVDAQIEVAPDGARFRIDWTHGGSWSSAETAEDAAHVALLGADTLELQVREVFVTPVEHVQVFAIERTPVRVK